MTGEAPRIQDPVLSEAQRLRSATQIGNALGVEALSRRQRAEELMQLTVQDRSHAIELIRTLADVVPDKRVELVRMLEALKSDPVADPFAITQAQEEIATKFETRMKFERDLREITGKIDHDIEWGKVPVIGIGRDMYEALWGGMTANLGGREARWQQSFQDYATGSAEERLSSDPHLFRSMDSYLGYRQALQDRVRRHLDQKIGAGELGTSKVGRVAEGLAQFVGLGAGLALPGGAGAKGAQWLAKWRQLDLGKRALFAAQTIGSAVGTASYAYAMGPDDEMKERVKDLSEEQREAALEAGRWWKAIEFGAFGSAFSIAKKFRDVAKFVGGGPTAQRIAANIGESVGFVGASGTASLLTDSLRTAIAEGTGVDPESELGEDDSFIRLTYETNPAAQDAFRTVLAAIARQEIGEGDQKRIPTLAEAALQFAEETGTAFVGLRALHMLKILPDPVEGQPAQEGIDEAKATQKLIDRAREEVEQLGEQMGTHDMLRSLLAETVAEIRPKTPEKTPEGEAYPSPEAKAQAGQHAREQFALELYRRSVPRETEAGSLSEARADLERREEEVFRAFEETGRETFQQELDALTLERQMIAASEKYSTRYSEADSAGRHKLRTELFKSVIDLNREVLEKGTSFGDIAQRIAVTEPAYAAAAISETISEQTAATVRVNTQLDKADTIERRQAIVKKHIDEGQAWHLEGADVFVLKREGDLVVTRDVGGGTIRALSLSQVEQARMIAGTGTAPMLGEPAAGVPVPKSVLGKRRLALEQLQALRMHPSGSPQELIEQHAKLVARSEMGDDVSGMQDRVATMRRAIEDSALDSVTKEWWKAALQAEVKHEIRVLQEQRGERPISEEVLEAIPGLGGETSRQVAGKLGEYDIAGVRGEGVGSGMTGAVGARGAEIKNLEQSLSDIGFKPRNPLHRPTKKQIENKLGTKLTDAEYDAAISKGEEILAELQARRAIQRHGEQLGRIVDRAKQQAQADAEWTRSPDVRKLMPQEVRQQVEEIETQISKLRSDWMAAKKRDLRDAIMGDLQILAEKRDQIVAPYAQALENAGGLPKPKPVLTTGELSSNPGMPEIVRQFQAQADAEVNARVDAANTITMRDRAKVIRALQAKRAVDPVRDDVDPQFAASIIEFQQRQPKKGAPAKEYFNRLRYYHLWRIATGAGRDLRHDVAYLAERLSNASQLASRDPILFRRTMETLENAFGGVLGHMAQDVPAVQKLYKSYEAARARYKKALENREMGAVIVPDHIADNLRGLVGAIATPIRWLAGRSTAFGQNAILTRTRERIARRSLEAVSAPLNAEIRRDLTLLQRGLYKLGLLQPISVMGKAGKEGVETEAQAQWESNQFLSATAKHLERAFDVSEKSSPEDLFQLTKYWAQTEMPTREQLASPQGKRLRQLWKASLHLRQLFRGVREQMAYWHPSAAEHRRALKLNVARRRFLRTMLQQIQRGEVEGAESALAFRATRLKRAINKASKNLLRERDWLRQWQAEWGKQQYFPHILSEMVREELANQRLTDPREAIGRQWKHDTAMRQPKAFTKHYLRQDGAPDWEKLEQNPFRILEQTIWSVIPAVKRNAWMERWSKELYGELSPVHFDELRDGKLYSGREYFIDDSQAHYAKGAVYRVKTVTNKGEHETHLVQSLEGLETRDRKIEKVERYWAFWPTNMQSSLPTDIPPGMIGQALLGKGNLKLLRDHDVLGRVSRFRGGALVELGDFGYQLDGLTGPEGRVEIVPGKPASTPVARRAALDFLNQMRLTVERLSRPGEVGKLEKVLRSAGWWMTHAKLGWWNLPSVVNITFSALVQNSTTMTWEHWGEGVRGVRDVLDLLSKQGALPEPLTTKGIATGRTLIGMPTFTAEVARRLRTSERDLAGMSAAQRRRTMDRDDAIEDMWASGIWTKPLHRAHQSGREMQRAGIASKIEKAGHLGMRPQAVGDWVVRTHAWLGTYLPMRRHYRSEGYTEAQSRQLAANAAAAKVFVEHGLYVRAAQSRMDNSQWGPVLGNLNTWVRHYFGRWLQAGMPYKLKAAANFAMIGFAFQQLGWGSLNTSLNTDTENVPFLGPIWRGLIERFVPKTIGSVDRESLPFVGYLPWAMPGISGPGVDVFQGLMSAGHWLMLGDVDRALDTAEHAVVSQAMPSTGANLLRAAGSERIDPETGEKRYAYVPFSFRGSGERAALMYPDRGVANLLMQMIPGQRLEESEYYREQREARRRSTMRKAQTRALREEVDEVTRAVFDWRAGKDLSIDPKAKLRDIAKRGAEIGYKIDRRTILESQRRVKAERLLGNLGRTIYAGFDKVDQVQAMTSAIENDRIQPPEMRTLLNDPTVRLPGRQGWGQWLRDVPRDLRERFRLAIKKYDARHRR